MLPIFHRRGLESGALKVRFQETGIPSNHKRPQGQGWAMDDEGYSYVTFTRPENPNFYQGIALKNGALYVSTTTSDDDYWSQGLRIGRDGSLKVGVPSGYSEGLQVIGGKVSVAGLTFFAGFADLGSGEVDLSALASDDTATFTRATTATTINSAGLIVSVASGVPRSWYWPDTLAYGGYLAEGARTNIALQSILPGGGAAPTSWSQDFGTGTSAPAASVYGNADGSVAYAQSASAERPYLRQTTSSLSDGVTYCLSFFLEATSGVVASNLIVAVAGTATPTVTYPVCEANPSGGGSGVTVSGRLFITFTVAAAGTVSLRCGLGASSAATGSATFSRPQLEAGSFPSSFIPTTTLAVARNADVLTYVFTGNADATQGTAYAELGTEWTDPVTSAFAISFSDANGRPLFLGTGASASSAIQVFDGTTTTTKSSLTDMRTASRKRASAFGGSAQSLTGDGATVATGAFDGSMGPGTGNLGIGCNASGGGNSWFGPIKNVSIQSVQFTDAQLVDMTS